MRARTVGKVAGVVLGAAAVGGLAAAVAWYRFQHGTYERSVAAARASLAAHHDEFMRDQARVGRLAILAPRQGARDAGPVIGPRLAWTVLVPGGIREIRPDGNAVDADAVGKDWASPPPEAWARLDFGWMAQLRDLDAWDVSRGSPPDDPASFEDPEPSVRDLLAWGELRIAKGLHDGAPFPALAEVEDLARLCFTAERWDVLLAGLGLLGAIDRTRAAAPAASAFQPATSREDREVMRRVILAGLAFGRLETPAQYDAELDRLALGKCAALREGAWFAHAFRTDLGEAMAADYARLERLLAAHPECPLRALRARWGRLPDPRWSSSTHPVERIISWIPAVHRVQGERMLAISSQPWFRLYEPEPANGGGGASSPGERH